MKQILLPLGILTVAVAAQALPPRNADDFVKESQPWFEKARKSPLYADTDGIWLPGTCNVYTWNSETNDWEFSYSVNYTYNERGQSIKIESPIISVTTEYTSTGQPSSVTTIYPARSIYNKEVFTYDEVTDKRIGSTTYKLEDDQWTTIYGQESRITRDEKGNITSTDDYEFNTETGELEPTGYYVYNYGADDKINEIIEYYYYSGGFISTHLKDIVWEDTNNQLMPFDYLYELCKGENRIKSCTVVVYQREAASGDMKAEYTDNLGSMNMQVSIYDTPVCIYEYSVLDENGSYSAYSENRDYSVDGSTIMGTSISKTVYKFDSHNTPIEYEWEYKTTGSYGSDNYTSKQIYDITYDPTYGYPIEIITMRAENGGEMQNRSREVFGDFAFFAGVDSPEVDADAPVEYYNLQGIRVTNPSNGIYIRRQGKEISKVLIK